MKKLIIAVSLVICVLLSSCQKPQQTASEPDTIDYEAVIAEANAYIADGKYEEAYKALYGICEYDEAKEMLKDFKVLPLKTIGNGSVVTKPRSYTCTYTYDENGVLISKEEVLPNDVTKTYTYTYDEMGRLIKEAVKKVSPNSSSYDSENKTKTENSSVTYTYNEQGDVINKEINEGIGFPYSYVYSYTYDENGRVESMYNEVEDETIYYTHNEQGLLITVTEFGIPRNYEYDESGNLIKVTWGSNWLNEYTYDSNNNLIKKLENYNIGEYNEYEYIHHYKYNEYGVLSSYSFLDDKLNEYAEVYRDFVYFYCPAE